MSRLTNDPSVDWGAIVDHLHESIITTDPEGYITAWNKGAERLFGHTAEEAIGLNAEICFERSPEAIGREIAEPLRRDGHVEFFGKMVRKSGETFDGHMLTSLVTARDGTVTGMVGYTLDITDRKAAEEALETEKRQTEEAQRLLEDAIESFTDGFVLYDADDRFVMCNSACRDDLSIVDAYLQPGVPFEEFARAMIGTKDLVSAEFNNEKIIQRRLEAHRNPEAGPWQMQMADGKWFLVHEYRTRDGGTVLIRTNITERVKAERALAESEERFRDFAGATSDWFWEISADGRFKFISEGFRKISDRDPEDFIGKNFIETTKAFEVEAEPDAWHEYARQIKKGEPFPDLTFSFVDAAGNKRFMQSDGVPVFEPVSGKLTAYRGTSTDVTERKRAEQALTASDERFRDYTEATSDWFWEIGTDGVVNFVSDGFKKISGRDPEDVVGKSFFESAKFFQVKAEPEDWSNFVSRATQGKPFSDLEFSFVNAAGEKRDLQSGGVPVFDPDSGHVIAYRGTTRDITKQKKIERALAESEERFSLAMQGANDGLWDWDFETGQVYRSPRYLEMLGYQSGEIPDTSEARKMLLHPDDHAKSDEFVTRCLNNEAKNLELEIRMRHKDGHYVDILSRGVAVRDSDGKLIRMVGTHTDVSWRKRAELALLESEEKFRAITEDTTDVIVIVDRNGAYKYISPSAARVSDLDADAAAQFIGTLATDLVHPEDKEMCMQAIQEAWTRPGETMFLPEFRAVYPNGKEILSEAVITALPNVPGVEGIVVSSRDISARKKAEADLLAAKEEAEYANKAKSQFLSSMNHELRTPMNAILGFTQLLEQSPKEPLTENQTIFVREILKSGHHMLELIGNVLDLAKIESGDAALDMKIQNPRPLIEDSLTMIKASAAQNGITLHALFPESELSPVNIDALKFRQVLLNLLSNAVKYNRQEGEVTLECATDGNGSLHITVSDTGKGIPDAMRDKVFEPFNRLGAESSNIVGTGIGLTVTKQLVESMGGAIGFDSVVGEGTTFWVNLPVASVEAPPAI